MTTNRLHVVILLLIAVVVFSACSGQEQVQSSTSSDALTPVNVQLSWLHTIEFAPLYAALDQGDFVEAGLDVTLSAGGYDADGNYIDNFAEVLAGNATYGVADSTLLLAARAEGSPVVAIATIYQRHPLALTSLTSAEIERPSDLVGRDVQISGVSQIVYQALLSSQGVDPVDINESERVDYTIVPLVNGDTEVIDAWITNEVLLLNMEDHDINMILPSDYGIDVYPNVIFTTEDMIANNPDQVQSFVDAFLAGMQHVLDAPSTTGALAQAYDESLDIDFENASFTQSLPLINPAGSQPGMMQTEVWQFTYDTLVEQDVIEDTLDVTEAYTLEFLGMLSD